MTITQLEYIVALENYKSFSVAAEKSSVTQPTLSMQVQKLEEELGVLIFDRSRQPINPTAIGTEIVEQAKLILLEANRLKSIVQEQRNEIEGTLRIGIIPTLAPFLLPLFLTQFNQLYPKVRITIEELHTDYIIQKLKNDLLDCGILATPLNDQNLKEIPLFYEPFVAYISPEHPLFEFKILKVQQIDIKDLVLLGETHCLRSQVLNLCQNYNNQGLRYEAASIETLRKMTILSQSVTLLPELATYELPENELDYVRYFENPEPVREISLVTHKSFVKRNLLRVLAEEIFKNVPDKMKKKDNKNIVKIKI